jgi:uncharacterized membrane protein (UPF0127 family)
MLVALAITAGACGSDSATRVALPGFGQTAYRVERGTATVDSGCALLATTPDQHNQGLMNVRDLKGYDGMIFQFPTEVDNTSVGFYMKDTPMALSIAWFGGSGQFVSSADMAPDRDQPVYYAAAPYRYAFEVPQGELAELGVGEGTTLVLGGDC